MRNKEKNRRNKQSKWWFTADTHFDHENIIKYTNRPFKDKDEMNSVLVEGWNNRVGMNDYVVVVGDFAFQRHSKWINALNGKKILVRGNHDKMSRDVERDFTEIHDIYTTKVNGQFICCCHYAMRTWPGPWKRTWHLYGHNHGRMPEGEYASCDVGVDVWDYAPVSMEMLSEKMASLNTVPPADAEPWDERVNRLHEQNTAIRSKFE